MNISIRKAGFALALAGVVVAGAASAATYSDSFNGDTTVPHLLKWNALGDACLTAGGTVEGIPACGSTFQGGASYTIPADETVAGQGALLLTPPNGNQTGAILSGFSPFPLSDGIQITFTTYTFGGDSGGTAKNGADGIVFFLTDGTKYAADGITPLPTKTGAEGGSMGYGCSNVNGVYDGVAYGYLGLGIDEFGNFLNTGDNGSVGIYNSNDPSGTTANGTNSYYDSGRPQYQPERIGLRGAGNTNLAWLSGKSSYYATGAVYNLYNTSATATFWTCDSSGNNCNSVTGQIGAPIWNCTSKDSSGTCNGWSRAQGNQVQEACRSGKYVTAFDTKTGTDGGTYQVPTAFSTIDYNYNAIPGGYAVLPGKLDCTATDADGNCTAYAYAAGSRPIANNSKSATRNPTSTTPASDIAWPITYRLTISSSGVLNFAYSYNDGDFQPVITNTDITAFNGPLPESLRFGFSAGTGGSNNVHEITCFTAAPLQANSSAGANTVTGKVTGNTQFFLASYSNGDWWGSLVADPLVIQSDGTLNVGTAANWDAKCVLTGAKPCDSMSVTDPVTGKVTSTTNVTAQDPASRKLLTSIALGAGNGKTLSWSNLSTAQQNALKGSTSNALDATPGQNRLAWLRGDRTVEQLASGCTATPTATPPCDMRARTYVLGDIINSSPTFVGAPTPGAYPDGFYDQLSGKAGTETGYSTFVTDNASRINVVYVGGNDGFLHGFEAGINGNGTKGAAKNDGTELVGYMPYDVLLNKAANLANPLYTHDYLVDATPVAGDVFYDSKWHTWLAGGVGSSGQEIYALDITDPSAATVIGDWDSSTLTHLGNTVGAPIIARMHNGQWAIIFGSGLHKNNDGTKTANADTTAGVYIGVIDSSGAVTFQFLDTKVGSSASPDGIAYVTSADMDGDHIADYLYAGDTQGNVWRFDVTNKSASKWASAAKPLFVAKDASGNLQPITTSITATVVQTGTTSRVMLFFGTGQQRQATATKGVQYAKGQQSFYGIWDWDMDAWNGMSTAAKYASLSSGTVPVTRDNLLAQVVDTTLSDATHRYLDNTKVVCWQGDTTATTDCPLASDTQYGWLFDLPGTGPATGSLAGQQEQIIYNPTLLEGAIVVNTAIPPEISAAQCKADLQSGWTMAFNPATGGGFPQNFFADAGGGFGGGGSTVGGTMVSGVGTPTSVQYGGKSYLVTQTITGGAKLFPINPQSQINPSRVSWRELVNP